MKLKLGGTYTAAMDLNALAKGLECGDQFVVLSVGQSTIGISVGQSTAGAQELYLCMTQDHVRFFLISGASLKPLVVENLNA